MNNLRFSTIIHILVLASKYQDEFRNNGKVISSDFIACSININPVVVRREIQFLKENGILDAKKGKDGGYFLIKNPENILFGDLYKLINKEKFIGKLNQTNPKCLIGKQMNRELDIIFNDVENDIVQNLNKTSLQRFTNQFKNIEL